MEHAMSKQVGLWIDHRKAVIVTLTDHGQDTLTIESGVERHVRYSAGARMAGTHSSKPGTSEDTRERRFEGQLDKYYEEVAACLRGCEAILIFGPGEAKGELKKRLDSDGLGARVLGVETVDKMTDRRIAAKVRAAIGRT
jgi:hypothetical protein